MACACTEEPAAAAVGGVDLFVIPVIAAIFAFCLAMHFDGGVHRAVSDATWLWFGAICVSITFAIVWAIVNHEGETNLSNRLRLGSQTLITVNGVVLGLVYKFTESTIPYAAKVGALALLVSLILALLVYVLVSGKIRDGAAAALSTGVFNLSGFALVYGLTCIVFAVILPT
jgi:hypothetical protein